MYLPITINTCALKILVCGGLKMNEAAKLNYHPSCLNLKLYPVIMERA